MQVYLCNIIFLSTRITFYYTLFLRRCCIFPGLGWCRRSGWVLSDVKKYEIPAGVEKYLDCHLRWRWVGFFRDLFGHVVKLSGLCFRFGARGRKLCRRASHNLGDALEV